jgi:hypothetical protein
MQSSTSVRTGSSSTGYQHTFHRFLRRHRPFSGRCRQEGLSRLCREVTVRPLVARTDHKERFDWPLGQSRYSQPDGTKGFKNMYGTGDSKAPETRARDERIKAHRTILAAAKTFLRWCCAKPRRWVSRSPVQEVQGVGKRKHGKPQPRIDEARKWVAKATEMAGQGESGAVAALTRC